MKEKNKHILLAIIFFVLGLLFAPKGKTETIEKEICSNENISKYEQIIDLDSKVIILLSDGLVLAGEGYQAVARGDADYLNNMADQLEEMTAEVQSLRLQKQVLLNEIK